MSSIARMLPAPHHRLLLEAALSADPAAAADARRRWARKVDLDTLDFGSVQLLPLLDLTDVGPAGDELAEQVRRVVRFTWLRTEVLNRRVAPALSALADAGLDPMLSKGAALVNAHGVGQRVRPMFDIDIAVPAARLADAQRVLHACGFRSELDIAIERTPARAVLDVHAAPFSNENGAQIDLHWHLLHTARNPELDRLFRARSVTCSFAGVSCQATGLEDSLVISIGHGTRWARSAAVRWVADVALLLRGHRERIDWDRVVRAARETRLSRQVADGLRYAGELVGEPVPAGVMRRLRRAPVPVAVRMRAWRPADARDGGPRPAGPAGRLAEAYEEDAGGHVVPGTRSGPADLARFLARRWGLPSARQVPVHAAWVALRRPRLARPLRSAGAGVPASAWVAGRGHYELGRELRFGEGGDGERWLGPGWWYTETHGVWSRAHRAHVVLPLAYPLPDRLQLDVFAHTFVTPFKPEVQVRVIVNGRRVARWHFDELRNGGLRQVVFGAELLGPDAVVDITLVTDPTMSPADARLNSDLRQIGVGLGSLRLAAVPVADLEPY